MSLLPHFQMFARYNRWANARILAATAALTPELYRTDRGAFFGSMHGTLNHLVVTDRIWMHRFTGAGPTYDRLNLILFESFAELEPARRDEDARICAFVDGLDDAAMAGSFTYARVSSPERFTQALAPALAHFFNHQTHHRGQAHAILTGLVGKAPELDLLYFQRETAAG